MNVISDRKQVRMTMIGALAFVFFLPPGFAQERAPAEEFQHAGQQWKEFRNQRDGFAADFPGGEVHVAETTWQSQTGFMLPARIYSLERGREHYSVTVADYGGIQVLGRARLKACTIEDEVCTGTPLSGEGYWKHDLRGAMLWAANTLMARDGVAVKEIAWNQIARVSTMSLSLTNTRDGSKTYALVTMNEKRLYICQATVPKEAVFPLEFGGSFGIFSTNADGSKQGQAPNANGGFAYPSLYSNEVYGVGDIPPPPPSAVPGGAREYHPNEFDGVPIGVYPPEPARPAGQ